MSVTYDEMIHALSEFESDEFLEGLAKELGDAVDELVAKGFRTATDPYGETWAPRQLAKGRRTPPHLPLDKSGDMKRGFHTETNRTGIRLTNPVAYTGFQNDGTRYVDARAMYPREGDLGNWERPLHEAALGFMASKLNEGV